jgi:RNA polymerase sigma-70 factor (ECF subfamily)
MRVTNWCEARPANNLGTSMDQRALRLARGDPIAFADLYDACADRVHHYLVLRLGSPSDAEDVLQETFVRLARNRQKLAGVENLVAYVFTTARNEANRLLARQDREGRLVAELAPQALFSEASSSDLKEIETAECVSGLLARLSDELREVIELKIYAELSFREISDVTGLPQGTVATRYRAALDKMRRQLAKELE